MSRLVSIIIPCHNAAAWLAATLESAVRQTWADKEIILVDDGSTDASPAVARSFASRGVRILTQPNRGAAAARNSGLRAARGDFVQFLDADDLLAPDKIARQLEVLLARPAGAIAAGPWGHFAADPAAAVFTPEPVWCDLAPIDWLVRSWTGGGMFPPFVWLAPRGLLDAAGPWNEALSLDDDGEYFCRALLGARQVCFVPEARGYYRAHRGSRLSANRGERAALSSFTSIELKARRLLAAEDTPRTRHALACHWQRFAWEQLADAPGPAAEAIRRAALLDPDLAPPRGPVAYALAARVLGWRRARRLQLAAKRLLRR